MDNKKDEDEILHNEVLKKFLIKWDRLSKNLDEFPMFKGVSLPDLIFSIDSGCGMTTSIKYLAQYLFEKKNLRRFEGDVTHFEFVLNYCDPVGDFTELPRLIEEIRVLAGFRNEYRGIIAIDINAWIEKFEEDYFKQFLEYLAINSKNILIILSIEHINEKEYKKLVALVSAYLRVELLDFPPPSLDDFFECLQKRIEECDFSLTPSAAKLLKKSIQTLSQSNFFDNYNTINRLTDDILYEVLSAEKLNSNSISDVEITKFKMDSPYILQMITNNAVRKIGFVGGRDNE